MHIPGDRTQYIEMNLLVVSCANQLINVYIEYKYSNNDGDHDADDDDDDESVTMTITTTKLLNHNISTLGDTSISRVNHLDSSPSDPFVHGAMCSVFWWKYFFRQHVFADAIHPLHRMGLYSPSTWNIEYTNSLHRMGLYPSSARMGRCFNETQLIILYDCSAVYMRWCREY